MTRNYHKTLKSQHTSSLLLHSIAYRQEYTDWYYYKLSSLLFPLRQWSQCPSINNTNQTMVGVAHCQQCTSNRQQVGVEPINIQHKRAKCSDHTSNKETRSGFLGLESVAVVVWIASHRTPDFYAWSVLQHIHYLLHSRLHSMCEGGGRSSCTCV